MAYVNVYAYDRGDIELDKSNIKIILEDTEKKLSSEDYEKFKEILEELEDVKIKEMEVYLHDVYVTKDDLEKAVEDYCDDSDDSDDYESGKEDGFEEGYNVGLNASEKLGQEFRRANWKILSKLEKYAYYNEKVDFSKDDAKEILDLINSI